MNNDVVFVSVFLGLLGIWMMGNGLWLTLGINRTWWRWGILPFQEGYFWAGIPAGVAAIFWAIGAPFPLGSVIKNFFFWGGGFFIFVGIIFSIWQPRFIKPKWLRDLEKRYPLYHDIKYLREQARNLDVETWREIVYDPDRLRQWADDEIRQQVDREAAEDRRKRGR